MTSDRPYRKGMTEEEGLDELRRHAGAQFDPDVVDAFEAALREAAPAAAGVMEVTAR